MADYDFTIRSQFTESGDDVYLKYRDADFSGSNWGTGAVAFTEQLQLNRYTGAIDGTKEGIVYINSHSQAFTADAGTDVITATSHGLANGETVRFKGTDLPAGLAQTTLYYVRDVTTHTFKVETTPAGGAVNITDAGSGTMTITAPSKRSIADEPDIGLIPAVASVALTGEGESGVSSATVLAMTQAVEWVLLQANVASIKSTTENIEADMPGLVATAVDASATGVAAVSAAADAEANKKLLESDPIIEDVSGVRKLKRYERGTATELIPAKTAKQPNGSNLTDPTSQRLAGYRE